MLHKNKSEYRNISIVPRVKRFRQIRYFFQKITKPTIILIQISSGNWQLWLTGHPFTRAEIGRNRTHWLGQASVKTAWPIAHDFLFNQFIVAGDNICHQNHELQSLYNLTQYRTFLKMSWKLCFLMTKKVMKAIF